MTKPTSIISPKTIGIVAALVVPMLLIPTSGNAKSSRVERHYLDHRIKVKQGNDARYDRRSERRALDRFFDQPAPKKAKQ